MTQAEPSIAGKDSPAPMLRGLGRVSVHSTAGEAGRRPNRLRFLMEGTWCFPQSLGHFQRALEWGLLGHPLVFCECLPAGSPGAGGREPDS